jgi:hypothetical protein
MTTPACQRERERLAKALKALRARAGLSGARLAGMLGWQQSKVSNVETRKQRLHNGTMPRDGAWPPENVAVFQRWIATGSAP